MHWYVLNHVRKHHNTFLVGKSADQPARFPGALARRTRPGARQRAPIRARPRGTWRPNDSPARESEFAALLPRMMPPPAPSPRRSATPAVLAVDGVRCTGGPSGGKRPRRRGLPLPSAQKHLTATRKPPLVPTIDDHEAPRPHGLMPGASPRGNMRPSARLRTAAAAVWRAPADARDSRRGVLPRTELGPEEERFWSRNQRAGPDLAAMARGG